MRNRLIIIGASGHGKVVADIADRMNKWEAIAFLDDDEFIKDCRGLKVIGTVSDAYQYLEDSDFFVAVGDNLTRKIIQEKLEALGVSLINLVHPSVVLGSSVEIGLGTAIMAGVVINSSCVIGKGCIINTSASLDHDSILEEYVHISPGVNIAGSVKVGKRSWIGIGSSIINNINIGEDTIIGAGSVVIKNLPPSCIAVGSPAKAIRINE